MGITVLIADLTPGQDCRVSRQDRDRGRGCADVSNFQDVARAVGEIEARCAPIDIVVNNAGITRDAMVHKMTPVQWDQLIAVNLTSSFNTTRCIVPGMRQRRWGRIISISSMTAQRGQVGQANYAAAKAGLIGFTKTIALEIGRFGHYCQLHRAGVHHHGDDPPPCHAEVLQAEAERIPAKRLGQAGRRIAAAASYLASDGAAFVTGQVACGEWRPVSVGKARAEPLALPSTR